MHDVYENRVRFAETDAQGIVFFGNYLTYLDETFVAYMEAIGWPYEERVGMGWEIHTVNVELCYRDSAEMRDRLVNSIGLSRVGTSSLEFEYACRRAADDEVLVEGRLVQVGVDENGDPTPVPDEIIEAIEAFEGGLPSE